MSYKGQDYGDMTESGLIRLEKFHTGKYSLVLWVLFLGFIAFVFWAMNFKIDEVARASGEVIASSRVQIIQTVDGGVLVSLNVKEGDRVEAGQVLAELDQTKIRAAVMEIKARLAALKAKSNRLTAEVTDASKVTFSEEVKAFPEIARVEEALFRQRREGLTEELRTLEVAARLAKEEAGLVNDLARSGDVNRSEVIRAEKALNDAKAKVINRKNRFLEEASKELAEVNDKTGQNEQILAQRLQQLEDSVIAATVPGIVKNIRVTTVGGVLRASEELMQVVPVNDQLIVESKVLPMDIALVRPGLQANIRFDPFDYTLFGGVEGEVVYVSADTLKENTSRGQLIYYRVHVATKSNPVVTSTGRQIDILPGMTAQLDIKTGQRTLLKFLLKPIQRTISESFGER
jgi:adhesin transport system membrane fusion protein